MATTAGTTGHILTIHSRRRPSKAWYCLALATVLLGVTAGVILGARATVRTDDRTADNVPTILPERTQLATAATGTLAPSQDEDGPSPEAATISVAGHDLSHAQLVDLAGAVALIWGSIAVGLTIVAVVIAKRSIGRPSLAP